MSKLRAQRAMEQTALKFGVSFEEVYHEIEAVIADAIKTQNPAVSMLWDSIPRQNDCPTPEEVIEYLSNFVGQ